MFPGRFSNVPETMWNFGWNPQTMGFASQFCGGDPMTQVQQSQTQAQLVALQQQNAMLNQQVQTQAQSHTNHLQQLSSIHQPPHTATPPVTTSHIPSQQPAPEPPTQVVAPSTQSGASTSLSPEADLQEVKSTVESSFQVMAGKPTEKPVQSTSPPAPLPTPPVPPSTPPFATIPLPTMDHQPPQPLPSFPRRSRSYHCRSQSRRPDKRPVSIHRSPRRQPTHRPRRSS